MKPVVQVENLSKKYVIRHQTGGRANYASLRDEVASRFSALFRKQSQGDGSQEEFWALRDVSFSIEQGQAVAIVGRNGAGKSTLLKLLSRITRPSTGRIEIEGHVASLLEVGTGFHQELTGRENIYLNGAILGMSRLDIRRNFDEIVAFAEVEKFIDTPVKRYSSGMYMRLAFAVAAHLEPEILIVDEVLAVGDSQFQKKCLGKMEQVSSGGRTVIFVSHNLAAVRALCQKGILLQGGRLKLQGDINTVADAYAQETKEVGALAATAPISKPSHLGVWMESITILRNGEPSSTLAMGDRLGLEIRFRSENPIAQPIFGWLIRSAQGANVVNANNYFQASPSYPVEVKEGRVRCDLGVVPLMPNTYSVTLWLCRHPHEQHHVEDVIQFKVEEKDLWGLGRLPTQGLSELWWETKFELLD